jgi:hypothetical protein
VKSLSLSKKKSARLVVIGIVAVSLFAAAIYYAVPDSFHIRSIAFALGPNRSNSMNSANSSVYSLIAEINVTFLNGTTYVTDLNLPTLGAVGAGELNSTDIKEIRVYPFPGYSPGLDLPNPFWAAIEYAADWGIRTSLTGEETASLGVLNVVNYTFGFGDAKDMSPPLGYRIPTLNYTLEVNGTGYWDLGLLPPFYGPWNWHMNIDQIQSILLNTTGPASISFDLDLSMNVYYQITTEDGTQTGNAIVGWSGRWGTLQLLNDGDKLVGLRYSFSDISLRMMAT